MITSTLFTALAELEAACDDTLRFRPARSGYVRTRDLSGDATTRSATTMRQLVECGAAEGKKDGISRQGQWIWRITAGGRSALDLWRAQQQ